ncbi:hypothetical protein [Pedobacter sp. N23S346]|uniref:hypothetical protein n=1 Tax=Pedobacter sp. N23S346 TaxID=3402750 RepID=UPI003AC315AA
MGSDHGQHIIRGSQPYHIYENKVLALDAEISKKEYDHSLIGLFNVYPTLTIREFAELGAITRDRALHQLEAFVESGELQKEPSKNGPLYILSVKDN